LGLDFYGKQKFIDQILEKYKKDIKMFKKKLIPKLEVNIFYDLKKNPFKFLKNMIYMNNIFEKMEYNLNNMLPLRHSFVPSSITIDTCCLVEILMEKNVLESYKKARTNSYSIWKQFFEHKLLKPKKKRKTKYVFNNMIMTNGYTVSVIQIRREMYGKNKKYSKKEDTNDNDIKIKKRLDDPKDLESLNKKELNELKNYKLIGGDPGKRKILQLIDENSNVFSYTSARRRFKTKMKRNTKRRQKFLDNSPETKLLIENFTLSGKTTNFRKFKKYIKERYKVYEKVVEHYQEIEYRKLNWYKHINNQKEEAKLVKEIKEKYGENIAIGIGNWSETKQMKNFMPTKGIGTKRLLARNFKTFSVDEFNTSKKCNTCKSNTKYYTNVIKAETFKLKKSYVHGLLCCTNKKCSKLWDRDTNGAKNILEIFQSYVYERKRPESFKRKTYPVSN
jgi:hypothetical protein